MSVEEDSDTVLYVSSYYFGTTPNADEFADFCKHTLLRNQQPVLSDPYFPIVNRDYHSIRF